MECLFCGNENCESINCKQEMLALEEATMYSSMIERAEYCYEDR